MEYEAHFLLFFKCPSPIIDSTLPMVTNVNYVTDIKSSSLFVSFSSNLILFRCEMDQKPRGRIKNPEGESKTQSPSGTGLTECVKFL